MKQQYIKLIIFVLLFTTGTLILLNNITLSQNSISRIMNINNGSMDSDIYLIYLEQSILTYKYLGVALMLIGGFGCIINNTFLD